MLRKRRLPDQKLEVRVRRMWMALLVTRTKEKQLVETWLSPHTLTSLFVVVRRRSSSSFPGRRPSPSLSSTCPDLLLLYSIFARRLCPDVNRRASTDRRRKVTESLRRPWLPVIWATVRFGRESIDASVRQSAGPSVRKYPSYFLDRSWANATLAGASQIQEQCCFTCTTLLANTLLLQ